MGLFNYNEEDFLDPDEIRLRRESEARARAAHRKCAANHADDLGKDHSPVINVVPHNNCKADHSDDISKKVTLVTAMVTIAIVMIVMGIALSLFS